jgi:hypothetical protein
MHSSMAFACDDAPQCSHWQPGNSTVTYKACNSTSLLTCSPYQPLTFSRISPPIVVHHLSITE